MAISVRDLTKSQRVLDYSPHKLRRIKAKNIEALNDDLSSKVDDRINERDKQLLDCPINDPDAILQILFSGRHISVNGTIMRRSSISYLMNGLNLMKGRHLGPE